MPMEKINEIWEEHKDKIFLIVISIVILSVLLLPRIKATSSINGGDMQVQGQSQSNYELGENSSSSQLVSTMSVNEETNSQQKIRVDVKGAVVHPGVVTIKADQRVDAVIEKSGGVTKNADLDQVNLAHKLTDQMLIYIPAIGEQVQVNSPVLIRQSQENEVDESERSAAETTDTNEDLAGKSGSKVNLNSATKEQLTELNGIGDKKADQIIAYRQQNGNFKTINDLKNVSGIGDKIFESLADQITVN